MREALRHLAVTGLIETRPRRGSAVAKVSSTQLEELFVAMGEIEATCARLAAMSMTPIVSLLSTSGSRRARRGWWSGRHFTPEDHRAANQTLTSRARARAEALMPALDAVAAEGHTSLQGLARALTARGVPTARGGARWSAVQVARALAQLGRREGYIRRPNERS